jgi:hypothetical protein
MIANQATNQHFWLLESSFLRCCKQKSSQSIARQLTSVLMSEVFGTKHTCALNSIPAGRYISYKTCEII